MRRLHPATIVIALLPGLRDAARAAFPFLIGSFVSGHGANQEWIAGLIGVFTGVFAIGTYWTTRFDIEPDHVIHQTGWIFRKDRRIPLEQIQNVNIRQNVLERLFKVATVDVETAMGRGRDLKLSVLSLPDAERFREELLGAARLEAAQGGAAEQPAVEPDVPVLKLNRHDLLLGAVTENHFVQMVVAIFTVGGPALGTIITFTSRLPAAASAGVFVGGLVLVLLGAWVWGSATYYLKYGDFTVRRNESIFRITYGLMNKVQMAIRPGRIEYLHLTVTLFQRWMERASLFVGTASTFGEAGVLAPVALFVERHVAYLGVSNVIPGLDLANLRWQPFHPVFYRARVIRSLFVAGIFASIAALVGVLIGSIIPGLLWGVYAFFAVLRLGALFLASPENGFAITEDAFVVRLGYFHQSISAMPIERMENMSLTQPFWWKKYQAVSFVVQAMKHRIYAGAISESAVEELMGHWGKKMEARENERIGAALAAKASEEQQTEYI